MKSFFASVCLIAFSYSMFFQPLDGQFAVGACRIDMEAGAMGLFALASTLDIADIRPGA
ncbi:hypothetical protein ACFSKY_06620 [Azotobacter chroococcum]|jgi:hypothetical protein|uniref:hypothetical protein n=1 Tax=Azotobacter chroococcum TaxID=353 RepID=UPI0013F17B5B|nr:hypothetical protein [Azotobacter chroococcum]